MNQFDCLTPDLDIEGYHNLEASAGTGKTFAVQHLTTRFILQNMGIDKILVVTFTKASTRELKSRIRSNLERLFQNEPPYLSALSPDKKVAARFTVEEALACFDQAQIFTIHGFCQRMLFEFGFDLGLGSLPLEGQEEGRASLRQIITDFLYTDLSPSSYSTQQLLNLMRYCNHDKKILVENLYPLVEQRKELPESPDYATSRSQFFSLNLDPPPLNQFLHLSPAFLKLCDRAKRVKKPFQDQYQALLSQDFDALLTLPSLFEYFKESNRSKKAYKESALEPFYRLGDLLSPLILAASDPKHTLIRIAKKIREQIDESPLEEGMILSPDDLLFQMKKALSNRSFRSQVSSRYQVVIIDEFQDTDPHQWDIFKTLFVETPIRAFYLVADPKQSIYGFRNADLETYFKARQSMQKRALLTTNYRCEPELLNSLNLLFSKQSHFPYTPLTPPLNGVNSALEDGKNGFHFFTLKAPSKGKIPYDQIELDYFFPFIAQEIQTLTQKKKAFFKDFAILVRDHSQASRIKTFLEGLKIPFQAASNTPLRETTAFSFMEALFTTLINPKRINHFLSHPLFQFTLPELKERSNLEVLAFLIRQKEEPFHKMISNVLGYHFKQEKSLAQLLVRDGRLDLYADLTELIDLLLEEGNLPFERLLDRLLNLPSKGEKYCRRPLADMDAVKIMTIHASKGLEFPFVFALGLMSRYAMSQRFLNYQNRWHIYSDQCADCQRAIRAQEKEKIRQLYVAMTRAKRRLYVPLLTDQKEPASIGKASPIELLLSKLPPLDRLIPAIHATQTVLEKKTLLPQNRASPKLTPPSVRKQAGSPTYIHSFSSLTQTSFSPSIRRVQGSDSPLPIGAEMGILLHSLLEKIIKEKVTHPYQKEQVDMLVKTAVLQTKFAPYLSQITDLIDLTFHHSFGKFCLADILPRHLHPEVEFLYADTPNSYCKGFIDLIFFHKSGYYIIDWKTNELEDYTPNGLHQAMNQNDYFLQAKIYMGGLTRYLEFQKDPYPILGCYYLFLRGLFKNRQSFHFIAGEKGSSLTTDI